MFSAPPSACRYSVRAFAKGCPGDFECRRWCSNTVAIILAPFRQPGSATNRERISGSVKPRIPPILRSSNCFDAKLYKTKAEGRKSVIRSA
jgi:hypothetical protein